MTRVHTSTGQTRPSGMPPGNLGQAGQHPGVKKRPARLHPSPGTGLAPGWHSPAGSRSVSRLHLQRQLKHNAFITSGLQLEQINQGFFAMIRGEVVRTVLMRAQ